MQDDKGQSAIAETGAVVHQGDAFVTVTTGGGGADRPPRVAGGGGGEWRGAPLRPWCDRLDWGRSPV
jgi:hypothetical protein